MWFLGLLLILFLLFVVVPLLRIGWAVYRLRRRAAEMFDSQFRQQQEYYGSRQQRRPERKKKIDPGVGEYVPFEKLTFGAYDDAEIKAAVDGYGRKTILVFGTETHICVLQTALGLHDGGYEVMLVDDCCGSRRVSDKESGLRRALCEGIRVSCSETVLFELTGIAGTDTFRTISALVK